MRKNIRLDPQTSGLTLASVPGRLRLAAGGITARTTFTKRFIVGGHLTLSAPRVQQRNGVTYRFRAWSDHRARSHDLVAPARNARLTAYYRAVKALLRVRTTPGDLVVKVAGKDRESGWTDHFKVGAKVWLAAPPTQERNGETWVFVKWSDGGGRIHRVTVGAARIDLRAVYRKA